MKRNTTVRILQTKTLLLYLVIRAKLLLSYVPKRRLGAMHFYSGYKGHKGTCLFQRCWSLCKSLPRITRYSNSVLVWRILTVVFLFNQFNSVNRCFTAPKQAIGQSTMNELGRGACMSQILADYKFGTLLVCPGLAPSWSERLQFQFTLKSMAGQH